MIACVMDLGAADRAKRKMDILAASIDGGPQ